MPSGQHRQAQQRRCTAQTTNRRGRQGPRRPWGSTSRSCGDGPRRGLVEIARAQENSPTAAARTAAMMAILGKTAAALIPTCTTWPSSSRLSGVTADQAAAAERLRKECQASAGIVRHVQSPSGRRGGRPLRDITEWMIKGQKRGGLLEAVLSGSAQRSPKPLAVKSTRPHSPSKHRRGVPPKVAEARAKRVAAAQANLGGGNPAYSARGLPETGWKSLKAELGAAERRLALPLPPRTRPAPGPRSSRPAQGHLPQQPDLRRRCQRPGNGRR